MDQTIAVKLIQAKETIDKSTTQQKRSDGLTQYVNTIHQIIGSHFNPALKQQFAKIQAQKLQASAVSSDFPGLPRGGYDLNINQDNWDNGWEDSFKTKPVAMRQLFWTIYDVSTSISFQKIEEGARLVKQDFAGAPQFVSCDYYGSAIEWTHRLLATSEPSALIDLMEEFANKFGKNKADNFYSLIFTAAALNGYLPLQGTASDSRIQRVVKTINKISSGLGRENKDKALGNTAKIPKILYAVPEDEDIIEAAFRVTTAALASGGQDGEAITSSRIKRVYTYNDYVEPDKFIMTLPKGKCQRGEVMSLTAFNSPIDPYTLNKGTAAWAIYGGAIADPEQIKGGNLT